MYLIMFYLTLYCILVCKNNIIQQSTQFKHNMYKMLFIKYIYKESRLIWDMVDFI